MLMTGAIILFVGSVLLSISIGKNYQTVFGEKPSARSSIVVRFSGWVSCLGSLIIFVNAMGFGVGVAAFFGSLTTSFFLVTMVYSTVFYFRSVKTETVRIKQHMNYSS